MSVTVPPSAPELYESLPLSQDDLRVLQVQPGNGEIIQCKLERLRLWREHATREYICLSYTWGDGLYSHDILVNGLKFQVKPNLYEFLLAVRKKNLTDWIFIDAICIDQCNLLERNQQVQQMGKVYHQALYVLIWLGHIFTMTAGLGISMTIGSRNALKRLHLNPEWFGHSMAFDGCKRIHAHPYWRRMWIVQEMAVARRRKVFIGEVIVEWDRFYDGYVQPLDVGTGLRCAELDNLYVTRNRLSLMSFGDALRRFRFSRCTDVKDRVYALLHMTELDIPVDYDLTNGELYFRVLNQYIQQHAEQRGWQNELAWSDLVFHLITALELVPCFYCALCWPAIDTKNTLEHTMVRVCVRMTPGKLGYPSTRPLANEYSDIQRQFIPAHRRMCGQCGRNLFSAAQLARDPLPLITLADMAKSKDPRKRAWSLEDPPEVEATSLHHWNFMEELKKWTSVNASRSMQLLSDLVEPV